MTNQPLKPGHGGPVPEPRTFSVPMRAPEPQCMGRSPRPYAIAAASFMFLCLAIMFGVIFFANKATDIGSSKRSLEAKQLGDLDAGIKHMLAEQRFASAAKKHPELAGEAFWAFALREGLLDDALLSKLSSLNSTTDLRPENREAFFKGTAPAQPWCSYTAPRMGELAELMKRSPEDRIVLVTFNSRNWSNYPENGVVVLWAGGERAEFLDFETAAEEFGITAEEWADPAGKLFGKKAPFQHTYE
ncbi:MAG: hypothetical protein H6841_07970 [Planctomycetes bacterium]|nr:hypothetical protein [Planctomycetota bacterium]MCB9935468.1 hypothetical protein [Planctomycetota bacterium]